MTGQISVKVTGPWRMLLRRDNQDVRVINANEDYTLILNNGAETANLSVVMQSTEMPVSAPQGLVDETKAFSPDPHEPDKTAEQRDVPLDPLVVPSRINQGVRNQEPEFTGDTGALGQPANIDGLPAGTTLTEAQADDERKRLENEERSRDAGAKEQERLEKERAEKEAEATRQANLAAQEEAAGKTSTKSKK